eukprot:Polyplicarium_translucidae@DN2789_c0_g1_i3.p1
MLPSSGGSALINGYDLTTQTDEARASIGYVSQDNVLFSYMKVREHLKFVNLIKGISNDEGDKEIEEILQLLRIDSKTYAYPPSLSGGQKRRVCIAMALLGKSKVLFFDEPTTGMDPYTRRSLWEALKIVKQERCVLLTTHTMDEADYLGDRIAIYAEGELKCLGSPFFLKSKLGLGYTLTLTKSESYTSAQEGELKRFILEALPGSEEARSVALEVAFRVPFEANAELPAALTALEDGERQFGVTSFSVSMTTMEEVFLVVGAGASEQLDQVTETDKLRKAQREAAGNPDAYVSAEGKRPPAAWSQFRASFIKNFYAGLGDMGRWGAVLCWPIGMTLFGYLLGLAFTGFRPASTDLSYSAFESGLLPEALPQQVPLAGAGGLKVIMDACDPELVEAVDTGALSVDALEDWLIDTAVVNSKPYPRSNALFFEGNGDAPLEFHLFHNATYSDSVPILTATLTECLLRRDHAEAKLKSANNPLPRSDDWVTSLLDVLPLLVIAIGLGYTTMTFGPPAMREQVSGVKHLQHIAGVPVWVYWLAWYAFDICCYTIAVLLTWIIMECFQTSLTAGTHRIATILVLFFFGVGGIPLGYLLSAILRSPDGAETTIQIFSLGGPMLVYVFTVLPDLFDSYLRWAMWGVCVHPGAALLHGLYVIAIEGWTFRGVGVAVLYPMWTGVVFFMLAVLVDSSHTYPWPPPREILPVDEEDASRSEESAVATERMRVQQLLRDGTPLSMENEIADERVLSCGLSKSFKRSKKCCSPEETIQAVDDVWFSIPAGQCFGYVGMNGCGKTTTVRMLTGDLAPQSGFGVVAGLDVSRTMWRHIGYCAQSDALFGPLTGRQHLELYARLAFIPEENLAEFVESLADSHGLTQYLDRTTGAYSGGTKRKLCLAVSFIGNPSVVFLDEPSSGVDPAARRKLWSMIDNSVRGDNRAAMLTTHSMEECEALCDKVAIMEAGKLQCIGTPTELKSKYGKGYQIVATILTPDAKDIAGEGEEVQKEMESRAAAVAVAVMTAFPGSEKSATGSKHLRFSLPREGTSLAAVFEYFASHKEELLMEEFAVSDATLESVFVELQGGAETGSFAPRDSDPLVPAPKAPGPPSDGSAPSESASHSPVCLGKESF